MNIDLQQFVGIDCVITLRDGFVVEAKIHIESNQPYPYIVTTYLGRRNYNQKGEYCVGSKRHDIIAIEKVQP